jgi:Ca2+-binding EF-hand superfamily protein
MIRSLDELGSEPKDQMLYFLLQQLHKDKVTQIDFYEFLEMITHRVNNKTNRRNMNKVF